MYIVLLYLFYILWRVCICICRVNDDIISFSFFLGYFDKREIKIDGIENWNIGF